jgi:hypothetical protein
MPAPTPGYVKNMIRRSLREIIDPSPSKEGEKKLWEFFQNECAYCGAPLQKSKKEGHIDHLLPSSIDGPNHISNRALSCARCNEAEKLDGEWHEFILRKNDNLDVARARIDRIRKWQEVCGKPVLDKEKLRQIEKLGDSATAFYEAKVNEARKLMF